MSVYPQQGDRRSDSYGAYYDLGPVSIPPKITYSAVSDRATGTLYYFGTDLTKVILSTSAPGGGVLTRIYGPYDGPYLPYGLRLFVSGGAIGAEATGEANLTSPVWLYNTANPNQQTYPEPSFIPSIPPPTVPGIPSSTPPSTGGGYGAFIANFPNNLPRQLTTILTTGMIPNLAMWNGTEWVTPAGAPLTGIL